MKKTILHIAIFISMGLFGKEGKKDYKSLLREKQHSTFSGLRTTSELFQIDSMYLYDYNSTSGAYDTSFLKLEGSIAGTEDVAQHVQFAVYEGIKYPYEKSETVVNSSTQVSTKRYYYWNTATETWDESSKTEYHYSGNQLMTTIYFNYSQQQWIPEAKFENSYAGGLKNKVLIEMWDIELQEWTPVLVEKIIYNSQGQQVELTQDLWMDVFGIYLTISKEKTSYDAQGQPILKEVWYKDFMETDWKPDSKTEYTYDSEGKELSSEEYTWDEDQQQFWLSAQETYSYQKNKAIITNSERENISGDIQVKQISDVYFTKTLSVSDQSLTADIILYPNPVVEKLQIKAPSTAHFMIYNLLGSPLVSSNASEIDVSHLPKGVYILKIQSQGQTTSRTFNKD